MKNTQSHLSEHDIGNSLPVNLIQVDLKHSGFLSPMVDDSKELCFSNHAVSHMPETQKEALVTIEKRLENSLLHQDAETFTFCLISILKHPICSRMKSVRKRLTAIVEQVHDQYLSWYQFHETMEMLRFHVFSQIKSHRLK